METMRKMGDKMKESWEKTKEMVSDTIHPHHNETNVDNRVDDTIDPKDKLNPKEQYNRTDNVRSRNVPFEDREIKNNQQERTIE